MHRGMNVLQYIDMSKVIGHLLSHTSPVITTFKKHWIFEIILTTFLLLAYHVAHQQFEIL